MKPIHETRFQRITHKQLVYNGEKKLTSGRTQQSTHKIEGVGALHSNDGRGGVCG